MPRRHLLTGLLLLAAGLIGLTAAVTWYGSISVVKKSAPDAPIADADAPPSHQVILRVTDDTGPAQQPLSVQATIQNYPTPQERFTLPIGSGDREIALQGSFSADRPVVIRFVIPNGTNHQANEWHFSSGIWRFKGHLGSDGTRKGVKVLGVSLSEFRRMSEVELRARRP